MPFGRQKRYKDGYGLEVLAPPQGQHDRDANVDIVFIHGLGGTSHSTWTKGDTFWPVDLLAKDFPRARIMTWGYDSRIMKFFGPVGQGSVHSHANELNNDLSSERSDPHQIFRPIIFFAHSLGGIVVKHALFRSWLEYVSESPNKDRNAAIERSTIAVIFAGTPHRGSDKAKWACIAGRLASVLQKDHNSKLSEALEKGSEAVETLQDWFKKIENNFHVFSFFEEVPMPKVGAIVESDSAAIHCAHEKRRMLHANHMDMVRFDSSSSNEYKKVKDAFKQVHQHELDNVVLRNIHQPPPRLSNRTSFQGAIQEPPRVSSSQHRLLEHQASRMSLESAHTINVEEVFDRPRPYQRHSDQSQSSAASLERFSQNPHRFSTTTLATVSSHNSRTSDQSTRSSGTETSPFALSMNQCLSLVQNGHSLAANRNRNFLTNLQSAQSYFQKALEMLQSPPLSSTSNHLDLAAVRYQMMDVSFNLSFHKPLSAEEKSLHLTVAEQYGQEAIQEARRSSTGSTAATAFSSLSPTDPQVFRAQTTLYLAIIRGRRAELLPRLSPPTPLPVVSQQKGTALADINTAIATLRSLNPGNLTESETFAQVWRDRLNIDPRPPPSPSASSSSSVPPPPPQQQQQPNLNQGFGSGSGRGRGLGQGGAVPEMVGTSATETLPAYSELSFAGPNDRGRGQLPPYTAIATAQERRG